MIKYGSGPQAVLRWYLDARISVKRFEVALATCNETSIEEVREAASEARVEEHETRDFRTVVPALQRMDGHAIPFKSAGKHIHQ